MPSTVTASSRPPSLRWSLSSRQSGAANRASSRPPPRHHKPHRREPHRQRAPFARTRRPFSVISILGQVHVLYQNPGTKKARWQRFRRACPAWNLRHELLRECFEPDFEEREEKYKGKACLQDFDYKKTVEEGAEYLESKDYLETVSPSPLSTLRSAVITLALALTPTLTLRRMKIVGGGTTSTPTPPASFSRTASRSTPTLLRELKTPCYCQCRLKLPFHARAFPGALTSATSLAPGCSPHALV